MRSKLQLRRILMASLLSLACIALPGLVSHGIVHAQGALDLAGREVNPLSGDSDKVVVLVFVRRDCPVSARYAPLIQEIAKQYSGRTKFWLVYPDKNDSAAAIREYLAEYRYTLPALRDPSRTLVKLARVQIAPEVAVFGRDHKLIYDGRIDDLYIRADRTRPSATTHELQEAISAAIAGRTPAHSEVRGVGCYISDLE